MQTPEILNEKIQILETYYAELLGDNACTDDLNKVWKGIKELKKQLFAVKQFCSNEALTGERCA